jgi:hypothetical protein
MTRLRRRTLAILVVVALGSSMGCVSVQVDQVATFHAPDGSFSVTVLGGQMADSPVQGSGVLAGRTVHALATTTSAGLRFAVFYADFPGEYLARTSVADALIAAAQSDAWLGTVTDNRPMAIAGNPGREERISGPKGDYAFRFVFVGNRLYSISASGPAAQVASAEANLFLDSFALDS